MYYRRALAPLLLFTTVSLVDLRAANSDDGKVVAIDLFEAEKAGDIRVRFIPTNATRANVLITNQTDRVLHLQLPEAIAAVPVLAQFGVGNRGAGGGQFGGNGQLGGNGQFGGQAGGGATQGVGGGFDAGQGQGFGGGNPFGGGGNAFMGAMRVPPNKKRKIIARTVCLEHGKPEPNPKIAYQMIPVESFTDDPRIAGLCRDLAGGAIDPTAAQALAWHLSNGLSWDTLAQLNRIESRYRGNIKYFTEETLKAAKVHALKLAAETVSAYESQASVTRDSHSLGLTSQSEYADVR